MKKQLAKLITMLVTASMLTTGTVSAPIYADDIVTEDFADGDDADYDADETYEDDGTEEDNTDADVTEAADEEQAAEDTSVVQNQMDVKSVPVSWIADWLLEDGSGRYWQKQEGAGTVSRTIGLNIKSDAVFYALRQAIVEQGNAEELTIANPDEEPYNLLRMEMVFPDYVSLDDVSLSGELSALTAEAEADGNTVTLRFVLNDANAAAFLQHYNEDAGDPNGDGEAEEEAKTEVLTVQFSGDSDEIGSFSDFAGQISFETPDYNTTLSVGNTTINHSFVNPEESDFLESLGISDELFGETETVDEEGDTEVDDGDADSSESTVIDEGTDGDGDLVVTVSDEYTESETDLAAMESTPADSEAPAADSTPAESEVTESEPESEAEVVESTPADSEAPAADSTPTESEVTESKTDSEPEVVDSVPADSEAPAADSTPADSETPAADSTPTESEVTESNTDSDVVDSTPTDSEVPATDSVPAAPDSEPTPAEPTSVPEEAYVGVLYDFESATEGMTLPAEVYALVPVVDAVYLPGEIVKPEQPKETAVSTSDGVWNFLGYDADEKTVGDVTVTFTGRWSFTAAKKTAGVDYVFVAADGSELPDAVTELLPFSDAEYENGTTVKAEDPSALTVETADGLWVFDGYDATELVINVDAPNVFTGTWSFSANVEYYTVSYKFRAADASLTLPEAVTALLPKSEEYEAGAEAEAKAPSKTSVTTDDGTWDFDGYDKDKLTVKSEGSNVFTGTWSFTQAIDPDETISIKLVKIWKDNSDEKGERPNEITVRLYKNGDKYQSYACGAPADKTDTWTYTIRDLPKYENGKEISWTVDEADVKGYWKSIDGTTITNTYGTRADDVKTGDRSPIALYAGLAAAALAVIIVLLVLGKKKK
ncbi:MAG: SHIRT domain-containing protein [Lachnospiraceae bacterium]|nr:SHIRT domain-containing protein [Lachnospiraceae bacterium]